MKIGLKYFSFVHENAICSVTSNGVGLLFRLYRCDIVLLQDVNEEGVFFSFNKTLTIKLEGGLGFQRAILVVIIHTIEM